MNEITTLFTAIGDFFTGSDWYSMVKWPFWILLLTVAFGGVYCAAFGKNTLMNQGISTTLNLLVIYLFGFICCALWTPPRAWVKELPFLSVTDQGVSLIDPLSLGLAGVAPQLLKLMILVFMISAAESFRSIGKTIITWSFFEGIILVAALAGYAIVSAGISFIVPGLMRRYAIIPVVLFIVVCVSMLCAKFIFTVVIDGGSPRFSSIYRFFTVNRGGSLFTVSAISFLLSLTVLFVMQAMKTVSLTYAGVNYTGLGIILVLILVTLFIFGNFFHAKKKS